MILRRRRLWFGVLLGLVLAGGAWLWAATRQSTTVAVRIVEGMSRDDVYSILGVPHNSTWIDESFISETYRYWRIADWWHLSDGHICVLYRGKGVDGKGVVAKVNVTRESSDIWQSKYGEWAKP